MSPYASWTRSRQLQYRWRCTWPCFRLFVRHVVEDSPRPAALFAVIAGLMFFMEGLGLV